MAGAVLHPELKEALGKGVLQVFEDESVHEGRFHGCRPCLRSEGEAATGEGGRRRWGETAIAAGDGERGSWRRSKGRRPTRAVGRAYATGLLRRRLAPTATLDAHRRPDTSHDSLTGSDEVDVAAGGHTQRPLTDDELMLAYIRVSERCPWLGKPGKYIARANL